MSVVEFRSVTKNYGSRTAVEDLTFEITNGECFGLVGPNGAGKSTTLKLLLGLIEPGAGEVLVNGLNPWIDPRAREIIGYVSEETSLYPDMSCMEIMVYGAQLHGLEPDRDQIRDKLALAGLKDSENLKVEELSKGMRKRLELASALVHDPQLLILDEPFGGLDPLSRRSWQSLLKELVGTRTVVLSSHDLGAVEEIVDRIGVLREGELIALNRLETLLERRGRKVYAELADLATDGDLDWATTIRKFDGVEAVERTNSGLMLSIKNSADRTSLARSIVEAGGELLEFRLERPTLRDLFGKLAGADSKQSRHDKEFKIE